MGSRALTRTRTSARRVLSVALSAAMLASLLGPVTAIAVPLPATPISHAYSSFDPAGMEAFDLGGSASVVGGAVRLTPASSDQVGTMFTKQPLRIRNSGEFSTSFSFRINGSSGAGGGAEGFTFVMASDKDSLVPSGLGYTGGGSSMRVEFDTYKDSWDINDNHITFTNAQHAGDEQYHESIITMTPSFDLDDGGIKYCWIDYGGGGFRIAFSDTPTRVGEATSAGGPASYMGDYGTSEADVYFGFTGATAAEYANHEIVSWYLDNKYQPLDPATTSYSTGPASLDVATEDWVDVDTSTEVTFTVTDMYGAPMANEPIAVTSSAGTLSAPTVTSDANGLATVTLTTPVTKQICSVAGETTSGLRVTGSLLVGDRKPIVDVPAGTTQVPYQSERVVAPGLEISDADDTTLAAALVRIVDESDAESVGVPGLTGPIVAYGTIEGDYYLEGSASLAEYEQALGSLTYSGYGQPPSNSRQVEFSVFDGIVWSDPVIKNIEITPMMPFAGADRYQTAIVTSQETFPWGSESVVIATGANWPDALGGSALAGVMYGPILLSPKDALPADVLAEIERLNPSSAYVLGGEGALSDDVLAELTDLLGEENVTRLGGADRYETAEIIADEVIGYLGEWGWIVDTAFVATGRNYPDALAAAPLAAGLYQPIYLSDPECISDTTAQAMRSAGITETILLGGEAVVSPETEAKLADTGITTADRIAGANRYETAAAIARYGVDEYGFIWDGVAIATGKGFADALAGGVAQAYMGSVMLLSDPASLSEPSFDALEANAAEIYGIRFLGGTKALSQTVRDQAMDAITP
ncbi:MAG: cell wall-binding repeat-containing protein [Actinomycetota bacterium]|nr:cell wall-binding repeat-containing protein [Actinomycetota bacterium]